MNKVINFHVVKDPIWFEKVIMYLKSKHTIVTAKSIYDYYYNHVMLENACLITVDDGHISSYRIIYPILKKHKVPAIFFVSPEIAKRERRTNFWFQEIENYDKEKLVKIAAEYLQEPYCKDVNYKSIFQRITIDTIWEIIVKYQEQYQPMPEEPANMTLEQIKYIDQEGLVEIGAHTLNHPFLSREKDSKAKFEIESSVSQLEIILQHPVLTFAYPNGEPGLDFGEREKLILKGTSVKLAFSLSAHDFSPSDDALSIPRYGITCGSLSFIKFKFALGKYYPLVRKVLK